MVSVKIDVFRFDSQARRRDLYSTATECDEMTCIDLPSLQRTMRFLYPKMDGLTVTIM